MHFADFLTEVKHGQKVESNDKREADVEAGNSQKYQQFGWLCPVHTHSVSPIMSLQFTDWPVLNDALPLRFIWFQVWCPLIIGSQFCRWYRSNLLSLHSIVRCRHFERDWNHCGLELGGTFLQFPVISFPINMTTMYSLRFRFWAILSDGNHWSKLVGTL